MKQHLFLGNTSPHSHQESIMWWQTEFDHLNRGEYAHFRTTQRTNEKKKF